MTSQIFPIVAASLIDLSGRVLIQKRAATGSMAGLWEFPGGKIDAGETPEAALKRELNEELGVDVDEAHFMPLTFSSAPLGDRQLLLLLYAVRQWEGVAKPLYAQEIAWVLPTDLRAFEMPPADAPFIPVLESFCLADPLDGLLPPTEPMQSTK